jgi:hypothetical protein
MRGLSPQEITTILGAVAALITAIGAATAKVISALRGEAEHTRRRIDEHEDLSAARGREIKKAIEKHVP